MPDSGTVQRIPPNFRIFALAAGPQRLPCLNPMPAAFRPAFTNVLIQRLMQGAAAINLAGSDDQGATRLLEDILNAGLPDVRVILADLAAYQQSYSAFMNDLSAGLGLPEPAEALDEIVEAFELHGGRFILLLNHIDAIWQQPDADPRFGDAFIACLGRFALAPNLALLAASSRPLEVRITRIEQFLAQGSFEPELLRLPPLALTRILEEIARSGSVLEPPALYAAAIYAHPRPYPLLQYVLEQARTAGLSGRLNPERQIARWIAAFEGREPEAPAPAGLAARLRAWWQQRWKR